MIVIGFVVGAVECFGNTTLQCNRAIEHIRAAAQTGNFMVAKMLVDAAVDDDGLACSDEQCAALAKLRSEIYSAYIIDRLRIAKDDVIERGDGHAALRDIGIAVKAAGEADIELREVDGLYAVAFFSAAYQDLEAAGEADKEGDVESRDRLRSEAIKFIGFARTLDPRIEPIARKILGP